MHVILSFDPISKRFQSPKHIIKAKDPRLALIDVAVPGFLTTAAPPSRTRDAQLPASFITKLLYSLEPPIPLKNEAEERTPKATQEVTDKDFEVYYRQEGPEDLFGPSQCRLLPTLLIAHAGGASLAIPMAPQPPIPTPTRASSGDAADKKRKRRLKRERSHALYSSPQPRRLK